MIGENIKRLMKENGYTQKQLAIRSQCTECAISRYISNEREPSIKVLKNLAISLGVTVDELINERKPQTNFEKITSSVESLAEHLVVSINMDLGGLRHMASDGKLCATWEEAKQRTIEWLQKESEG